MDEENPSGTAVIFVDDKAENEIVIVAGANGMVGETDLVRDWMTFWRPGDAAFVTVRSSYGKQFLLLRNWPMKKVLIVIFDPAPVKPLTEEIYGYLDVITPNETEASALVGFEVNSEAQCSKSRHLY